MFRLIVGRVLTLVPLMLMLTIVVFALAHIAPGDPAAAIAGPNANPEMIEQIRVQYGFDRPLWEQYFDYVWRLLHGDLGTSYSTQEPIADVIARRLPRTASICALAILIAIALSIPFGTIAAMKRNTWLDKGITAVAVVFLALPPFVLAAILIQNFALGGLRLFPPGGYVDLSEGLGAWLPYAILPAITIATISVAELTRIGRGSLVDVFEEDYMRTARAKGLSRATIVGKHAMKNAAVPYVTILGLQLGRVIGAAVIVEAVFNIPGFGLLGVEAVLQKDLPTMQGVVLVSGIIVLLANLAVDISYGYFNPRARTK